MEIYASHQVEEISVDQKSPEQLKLKISTMLESAKFLAGARIDVASDENAISLVRCNINHNCKVDFVATPIVGSAGVYEIVFENFIPNMLIYSDKKSPL